MPSSKGSADYVGTDSGNTSFIINCSALVLLMALPGIVVFYGGLTGFKKSTSTCLQTFAIASLISITWLMFGFSLAFGSNWDGTKNKFIGGAQWFWFWGDGKDTTRLRPNSLVGTIPLSVFIMYQMTFAILTAVIAAGSFAERMKFPSMLIFFFIWHCLVYCPVAHWHWGEGYFARWGVLDFAGGHVVHIVAGTTALVGSIVLDKCCGKRNSRCDPSCDPSFKPPCEKTKKADWERLLPFIGASLFWIGSFGFNAGSALSAGTQAGMAALITHLCASTCAFTWMVIEWLHLGKPSIVGVASGAVTGLVVITSASGFVDHTGSFVMGLLGAPLCYVCVFLKNKFGLDQKPNTCNRIDAFGVHAIGGMMGSLMLGFFAKPEIGGPLVAGVFYKLPTDGYTNGRQLGWQIVGIILTMLYTAFLTLILFLILYVTIGICEPEEADEEEPKERGIEPERECVCKVEYITVMGEKGEKGEKGDAGDRGNDGAMMTQMVTMPVTMPMMPTMPPPMMMAPVAPTSQLGFGFNQIGFV